MNTIHKLFDRKADEFTHGKIGEAGDTLVTPTALYVDGEYIPILDDETNGNILFQYRLKLQMLGYAKTEYEIVSSEQPDETTASVEVDWRHLNAGGDMIASLRVVHFCRKGDDGWHEELAEIITAKSNLVTDILFGKPAPASKNIALPDSATGPVPSKDRKTPG